MGREADSSGECVGQGVYRSLYKSAVSYGTERDLLGVMKKSALYLQPDWRASVIQSDSEFLRASSVITVEKSAKELVP